MPVTQLPEYEIWKAMKQRCTNPKHVGFPYYGGRGIAVCESWTSSFDAFFADMGKRPTPKHSIDRIDNDEGYYPSNCKWSTREEQEKNKRPLRAEMPNTRNLYCTNSTGFKGVTRLRKRFAAQIGFKGKRYHIGVFDTPEDAHHAYVTYADALAALEAHDDEENELLQAAE